MTLVRKLASVTAAALALAGCVSSPPVAQPAGSPATGPPILEAYGLAGLDGRQIVDRLERTPLDARQADLTASVRPGELLLSAAGSDEVSVVDLPDEQFYLSVAPYLTQTHECYFHSLTTCRGELAGEEIHVTITDRDSGEVLVDELTTTFDTGFVGFWLPSGIEASLRVAYDGYSASADIATGPDDPTCLTTVHLQPSA